jgi:hypothetical protein
MSMFKRDNAQPSESAGNAPGDPQGIAPGARQVSESGERYDEVHAPRTTAFGLYEGSRGAGCRDASRRRR